MQKLLFVIAAAFFCITVAYAQLPDVKHYPNAAKRIKAVNLFIAKVLKTERYDSLLMGAKIGYAITRNTNDNLNNSIYCYYIGAGYSYEAKNDSAIFYYQLSENYGARTNIPARVVNAQLKVLDAAPRNSKLQEEYFKKLQQSLGKYKNNLRLAADITSEMADIYNDKDSFENALKYHMLALGYQHQLKDTIAIGTNLVNIGNMYMQMSNNEKALLYLNEALPYLNDYKRGQMMAYYNIASCYIDMEKTDAAIINYQKANNIAKAVRDTEAMYSIEQRLATALTLKKQYAKAQAMLLPAARYADKIKSPQMISDAYQSLGELYLAEKKYPAAIGNLSKALATSKANEMKERVAQIFGSMAKAEAGAGDFSKAYEYQNQFILYKDTLSKEGNKKTLAEMEQKYQTEKKQQQINLLNQKEQTQKAELQTQKRTKYFLLGGLAAVIIIVLLMVRSYWQKQSANQALAGKNLELEEKNITLNLLNSQLDDANRSKTKLFGILSHDLRAPVSSLFQFLSLQKNNAGKLNEEQRQKHNTRIITSAENLMNSMEDLLIWSKSQMDAFVPKMEETTLSELVDETIEFHAEFAKSRQISLVKADIDDAVIKTDLNFLKIVLRNITSNGTKFTSAGGSITFSAKIKDDEGQLVITDTGQGMDSEQIKNLFEWSSIRSDSSGMGLRLAKEFTERLGGRILVSSEVGKGTAFIVCIPLIEKTAPAVMS